MILQASALLNRPEFAGETAESLQPRIDAIEGAIRGYTNNHFQCRDARAYGCVSNGVPLLACDDWQDGDTIEVSGSLRSDGLYTWKDGKLSPSFSCPYAVLTLVQYPADVVEGAKKILLWEQANGNKAGIKSETISRWSVTYSGADASDSIGGYPASIMGFLAPYRRPRF